MAACSESIRYILHTKKKLTWNVCFILSYHRYENSAITDMRTASRALHFASKMCSLITISQQRNSLTNAIFKSPTTVLCVNTSKHREYVSQIL